MPSRVKNPQPECQGGCGRLLSYMRTFRERGTPWMCLQCRRERPGYRGKFAVKTEPREIACAICSTMVLTVQPDQKTCSDDCRGKLKRIKANERQRRYKATDRAKETRAFRPSEARCRIYVRNCAECDRLFVARSSRTKLCGHGCQRRYLIKQVLDRHYGYVATGMPKRSLLDYLVQRDHGRCGICRKSVREKGGPMRPSIDHIWPRSLGGSDELGNLQLAHYQCNLDKGNRAGHEQPLLVG